MSKKAYAIKVGVIIAVLGIGGFVVSHQWINQGQIRQELVKNIEQKTGLHVKIKTLKAYPFPYPLVEAQGITLSNKAGEQLFEAQQLTAHMTLWSLFDHQIFFRSIQLENVKISLERFPNGEVNWQFSPKNIEKKMETHSSALTGKSIWKIGFKDIQFQNLQLHWKDQITKRSGNLILKGVMIHQIQSDKFSFEANGSARHIGITLSGRLNGIDTLFTQDNNSSQRKSLKFQINLFEILHAQQVGTLHIGGEIVDPIKGKNYQIILHGMVLQLNSLNAFFPHAQLPELSDVTLNAQLRDHTSTSSLYTFPRIEALQIHTGVGNLPEGRITALQVTADQYNSQVNTNLQGIINQQKVEWSGTLGSLEKLQNMFYSNGQQALPVKGLLSLGKNNIQLQGNIGGQHSVLQLIADFPSYEYVFPSIGRVQADDLHYQGKLSLLYPIELNKIKELKRKFNHDIVLDGQVGAKSVQIKGLNFNQFSSSFLWKEGLITLDLFQLKDPKYSAIGSLNFETNANDPVFLLKLTHSVLPMVWVENLLNLPSIYAGNVNLVGNLSNQNGILGQKDKKLKGEVVIIGNRGVLKVSSLHHFMGKTLENLPLKENFTVRCLVLRINIDDPILQFNSLNLQSDKLSIHGTGIFNMSDNTLNFQLNPRIYFGKISAATSVKIAGSLDHPLASLDKNREDHFSLFINAPNLHDEGVCGSAIKQNFKN